MLCQNVSTSFRLCFGVKFFGSFSNFVTASRSVPSKAYISEPRRIISTIGLDLHLLFAFSAGGQHDELVHVSYLGKKFELAFFDEERSSFRVLLGQSRLFYLKTVANAFFEESKVM